VLAVCVSDCGEGRLSRSEQLVWYFYNVPILNVAYCLALSGAVYCASQWPAKSIYFDSRRRDKQS